VADVTDPFDDIRDALRAMPVPEPRPGFVDRALREAVRAAAPAQQRRRWWAGFGRREAWWGAAVGAMAATLAVVALLPRPAAVGGAHEVALALNEAREISVVIDSERELTDATIKVYVSGGVELQGFGDQPAIEWTATLGQGANVLALPVYARLPGEGRLVAVVEHGGRTKRAVVDVRVLNVPATGAINPQRLRSTQA
jgi:hypothetical protein